MNKHKLNKKVLITMISIGAFFVLASIAGYILTPSSSETVSQIDAQELNNQELTEDEIVSFVNDVLNALHNFYFASIDTRTGNEDLIDTMVGLKQWNKRFEDGVAQIKRYAGNSNEIVQVVVLGMVVGAQQNIEANELLLGFLENLNESNSDISRMNTITAESISMRKEGYSTIMTSAPFAATLIYPSADSENPTGTIPYKISEENRLGILKNIDRLFGHALIEDKEKQRSLGEYNAILLAVNNIKENISYKTYEDYFNTDTVKYPTEAVQYNVNKYSADVQEIQTRLNELNYEVEVDGYFGNETKNAVIEFQKNNKLNQDGIVGELTWNALFNKENPVSKVIQPAFISIPSINELKRADNDAYYIAGSTSSNCKKIVVSAVNTSAGIYDTYQLSDYKKGDTTFKYGIREDWSNLGEGENSYTFTAYCEGEQMKEASTTLNYTVTQPTYNYNPAPQAPISYPYYNSYTSDVIESQIDGEFEGWDGDTIFPLTNGQIWQQDEYDYEYEYEYMPDVLIYKSGSVYKMQVEGMDEAIEVKRLK